MPERKITVQIEADTTAFVAAIRRWNETLMADAGLQRLLARIVSPATPDLSAMHAAYDRRRRTRRARGRR